MQKSAFASENYSKLME